MKNLILTCLMAATLAACGTNQPNPPQTLKTSKEQAMETKAMKDAANNAFLALFKDYSAEGVRKYIAADIIQHNPFVPTGRDALIGFLPALKQSGITYTNHRILQDGEFVVLHNSFTNAQAFGAPKIVTIDIYRMKDGQAVEHWDAITPVVEKTASGRSQVDGATTITDLDKTAANKALAVSLIEDVLMGKNPSKITEYISAEQYHQHNPGIKDGLSGIVEAVQALTAQKNMFKYKKIHKVLGEGNFVLTVSEGEWSGKPQVFYDLFRVQNGKMVEHWDVIQEIPTQGLDNSNGMLGFQ
ncbi:MAG: nuclear transport factor 2 family protein [Burkholderiaceae bacterium]